MKILIMGPQGSGKGTQAKKLAEHFDIPHISTGDIFREHITNQTELGKEVQKYLDEGVYVPDELTNKLVDATLSGEMCAKGFILDGFPRTVAQAEALDQMTVLDKIVVFELSEEECIKRASGRYLHKPSGRMYNVSTAPKPQKVEYDDAGNVVAAYDDETGDKLTQRKDDTIEGIKSRLNEYEEKTTPVIDFYQKKHPFLLLKINADQSIDDVWADIDQNIHN